MEWLYRYGTWMDVVGKRHPRVAGVIIAAAITVSFHVRHGWIIWVVLLALASLGGLGTWLDDRALARTDGEADTHAA